MKIIKVNGREIYDSRGMPALECELILENKVPIRASIPCGKSRGSTEAVDLRDGGKRLMGLGLAKAIKNLEHIIEPELLEKEPHVVEMDAILLELDDTANKEKLGGNTLLSASIAIAKAQAYSLGIETYELIAHMCNLQSVSIPYPMFNLINGGSHARNNLTIQEIMLVPLGFNSFREAMEASCMVSHVLEKDIIAKKDQLIMGDEGGFAVNFESEIEAFDMLMDAIVKAGYDAGNQFKIALDVAASTFYDKKNTCYRWADRTMSTEEMVAYYAYLVQQYPIYSIEDGLEENDWKGWTYMNESLGSVLQIVGDDLFTTHPARIAKGIEQNAANAAIIKPNQVGTLTETLQAIMLCKEYGMNTVVSHRSGETEDTFITDLAVGTNAGQLKAGGLTRGERLAKYNRLLRIEDSLHFALLDKE